MSEPEAPARTPPRPGRPWIWIVATSLFVVVAFGAPFFVKQAEEHLPAAMLPDPAPPEAQQPKLAADGGHYYVLLAMVEVEPRKDEDSGWDPRDNAPDLRYEVQWQQQMVFESSTKDDTLLAKWSNTAVEFGDLLEAVSLDDSFKAARVTVRAGESLGFKVYDVDMFRNDLVGEWSVDVDTLKLGDQTWERPGGRVVKAICRVLPLDKVKFEELTR